MKTGYRRKVDGRNGTNEHRRVAKASQHSNPNGPDRRPVIPDRKPKTDKSRPVTSATDAEGTSEVNAQEASGLLDDTYVAFFDGR